MNTEKLSLLDLGYDEHVSPIGIREERKSNPANRQSNVETGRPFSPPSETATRDAEPIEKGNGSEPEIQECDLSVGVMRRPGRKRQDEQEGTGGEQGEALC